MRRIKLLMLAVMVSMMHPAVATTDASEPFIGEMKWVAFTFAPRGWAECDGQLLPISQNQSLFSLIGTVYGGDGRTTFALPDMRGRVMVHEGTGPGLSQRTLGAKGGAETVTLSVGQLPSHSHSQLGSSENANNSQPHDRSVAKTGRMRIYDNTDTNVTMDSGAIGPSGGGSSHENMGPTNTLHCIIALTGIFPSRN